VEHKNDIVEENNALRALLDSPGWRIVRDTFLTRQKAAYEAMYRTTDPNVVARNMGEYRAYTELLRYPADRVQANNDALRREAEVDSQFRE